MCALGRSAPVRQNLQIMHPEGPNIGPASDSCWFDSDSNYPAKTDLLHTGHLKGGKLLIVSVHGRP